MCALAKLERCGSHYFAADNGKMQRHLERKKLFDKCDKVDPSFPHNATSILLAIGMLSSFGTNCQTLPCISALFYYDIALPSPFELLKFHYFYLPSFQG